MHIVRTISISQLTAMAAAMYGNMVKAVIDIQKDVLVVDMEMHIDGEQTLLEAGSKQDDLWGINLYPGKFGTDEFIEYDSMINIRPGQKNMSRDVEDPDVRQLIMKSVEQKVIE